MSKTKTTLICEHCGEEITQCNVFDCFIYCDACLRMVIRAQAVQEMDSDQEFDGF